MRVVGHATVQGERIMFGSHCVDRFRERVEAETFSKARSRLVTLIGAKGRIRERVPSGVRVRSLRDQIITVGYLTFEHAGQTVVLPLVPWPGGLAATTCLTTRSRA